MFHYLDGGGGSTCYILLTNGCSLVVIVRLFCHSFQLWKKWTLLKFSLCSQVMNRNVETRVFGETGKEKLLLLCQAKGPWWANDLKTGTHYSVSGTGCFHQSMVYVLWLAVFIGRGSAFLNSLGMWVRPFISFKELWVWWFCFVTELQSKLFPVP